ncbi:MAG: 2-oxo acid dehydrogenase subunit E2, partial [Candidatus Avispirillum sp.]
MANPVIMPRQGQSVESCIITAWHKKPGDAVNEGDVLFSYETDKSAFDEKSLFSGTLLKVMFEEGDVVPCLDTVCFIGDAGEDVSSLGAEKEDSVSPAENEAASEAKAAAVAAPAAEVTGVPAVAGERIKISPRAKNLALKTGVDMTGVSATGPHGRIIERDINAALDKGAVGTVAAVEDFLAGKIAATHEAEQTAEVAQAPAASLAEYEEVPMSGVRRAIARSMHASLSEMAQLTLNASFDATALLEYRKQLKAGAEAMGLCKISLNDMVMYAVSRVLPEHPAINATLTDNTLRIYKHAN